MSGWGVLLDVTAGPAIVGGSVAVLGGAFALGLRHGIDWDHIAAISDITSTTATAVGEEEAGLTRELGVLLTDEGHHRLTVTGGPSAYDSRSTRVGLGRRASTLLPQSTLKFLTTQRTPLLLGTLYALGHATVVTLLGLLAILAAGILPDWIDPIMGRIVGVTLLFLAGYLYYSIYRFFRGGTFRLRSRWMIVFSAVRNGSRWLQARLHGHEHHAVAHTDQYGPRTAYGVGLIHGVGAETGTQVVVIATAVGADSTAAGVAALFAFVAGLFVSNSFVIVATAAGFVTASKRQGVYVAAGFLAATFSLVLGVLFLTAAEGILPELDPYVLWN